LTDSVAEISQLFIEVNNPFAAVVGESGTSGTA